MRACSFLYCLQLEWRQAKLFINLFIRKAKAYNAEHPYLTVFLQDRRVVCTTTECGIETVFTNQINIFFPVL